MKRIKIGGAVISALLALLAAERAFAANSTLSLPAPALERTGKVPVVFHLHQGFTGRARVHIRWTDSLNRVVADRTLSTHLQDETRITFHIDMARAVAMQNHLHVEVTLAGRTIDGAPYHKHKSAAADFVARPPAGPWNDYAVFMWQSYPKKLLAQLKKLGVNAGVYSGHSAGLPSALIDNNIRWYSGNLAPKFYSAYHHWWPDRKPGWAFAQTKQRYRQNPDSLAAFKRHPSLWDPHWRKLVHDDAVAAAKHNAPYRPYFYSLADEPGIAELGAPWDFDFSDQSLVPMRRWLRHQYTSLGALNREWGTHFTAWNRVVPPTTNQAMAKPGHNFAAWADFKTWMAISFANALKLGVDAIRKGDPNAYVAITGAQKPGWGGYDYARLTKVLTAIEPYDIGRNVDIIHSLAPLMPIITTSFASGSAEKQRVWHELLHGNRGLIIWDGNHDYVRADGQPSRRAVQASRYLKGIRAGEGALIINSHPLNDRIAIDYSQPSLRTQWMRNHRADGDDWTHISSSYANAHDPFLRLRESWCDLIEDEGLQYDFVAYDQIPQGILQKRGYPVLILPASSALSLAAAQAIRAFVAAGGIAIADSVPGTYDAHSRQRARSPLADLFGQPPSHSFLSNLFGQSAPKVRVRSYGQGKAIRLNVDIKKYLQERLKGKAGPTQRLIAQLLRKSGVHPPFVVDDGAGHPVVGIDLHVFANGGVRILALQANPQLRVKELGPPDFRSNRRFKKPITVHLHLPRPMYVYNTRTRKALGQKRKLTLTIDAYAPTILTASNVALPKMQVSVPSHAQRGSMVTLAVHARPAQAETSIFHITVRNPQGQRVLPYSGNLIVQHGGGAKRVPLAVNDTPGRWTVTVHDLLSGQVITRSLDVE